MESDGRADSGRGPLFLNDFAETLSDHHRNRYTSAIKKLRLTYPVTKISLDKEIPLPSDLPPMKQETLQVILPSLRNWAQRPDAATDLKEIFGAEREQTSALLDQIRQGDFSWLPGVEVLPSSLMEHALGAYSRETGTIYLSADCPTDLTESVLLEEIGHHIDALFNASETPGDEGALFSAAVRGITLSDEEIAAILNEDDSALLTLKGRQIAVECASRAPIPTSPRKPTTPATRQPVAPIVTVKPGVRGNVTPSGDWVTKDVDYNLVDEPTKRGLSLVGGGNLVGIGNSGGTSKQNTLDAASNTGNTTLIAGTASTSMRGGSGDNWFDATQSQGTVSIQGGTGNSTMYAANGPATLVGGGKNNFLVAGTSPTRTLGQSLVGGRSTNSLHGNTLYGGTGRDTLRSVAGFSTLISGSNPGVSTTIGTAAASGVTSIRVANAAGLAVGQQITGNGIAAGTTITAIAGTQLTLSARTTAAIVAGTRINTVGNILIGGGSSNSLVANVGNDSLAAISGNSTLLGGTGRTTLLGGAAGSNNWLQSGSIGTSGNTLIGGAGSNTLVAGTGIDSIVGGANQNLLLVTQANRSLISNDTINLSTLPSARNTLGVSLNAGTSFVDDLISGTFRGTAKNLSRVENVASVAARIELGLNAEAVGVRTLASGTTNDTLSAAGYQNASVLLDGSRSVRRLSMVGGARNDTLLGSRGGVDTLIGGDGNDSLSLQNASISLMSLDGGTGSDTLRINTPSVTLQGGSFSGIRNIENLALSGGSNLVESLQGSGINYILGGSGSDTLSANVVGSVRGFTGSGSTQIVLSLPTGTTDLGFKRGQVVSGNGIALGTTITNDPSTSINPTTRTVTLTLSTPTTASIARNSTIAGWLTKANGFLGATLNGGTNTNTNGKGDYLVSGGSGNLLIGSQADNNTLVSGVYDSNTLSGGSGRNLYILNNKVGWNNTLVAAGENAAGENLPWILNNSGIQSASTLQFTGDAIKLTDQAFAGIGGGAAQVIRTANGNNRIEIGEMARPIGIQTIIGGLGSDTFTAPIDYLPSVYFDASRGSGNQSLSAGNGNDTLLAGSGSATIEGGDGNNSLIGGPGNNLIHSGEGNSTLDGGFGISTLQAEGGDNLFVVRNRFTRILGPSTGEDGNAISQKPLVGTVNTYVNFDPIQGSPSQALSGPYQFSPTTPDGSPSITKAPSFASSDLSTFYNLQYFNLLGTANYGVGNALDNTISATSANALILGMGGNNTLIASGANSTLYGNISNSYSNPDLYAYAPVDTKTQEFVDGVIGIAGNNSLVANGANSFLDGGEGYNDGNFGSGSNTLIGTKGNNTLIQRHQADVIQATSLNGGNTLFTSVDLYRLPDNVSDVFVLVTPQATNSGQITQEGQRMTAGYVAVNDATGGYTGSNLIGIGNSPQLTVNNSLKMQVHYGSSDGTTYGSPGVDADQALDVGDPLPDPKDPSNKNAVTLSWTVPTPPGVALNTQTTGYVVKFRCLDAVGNALTPWLTYLSGSSQDLGGSSVNPRLLVDNLPNSVKDSTGTAQNVISYDFQVTAQETVLPAVTDMDPDSPTFGQLIARPVSLIGGGGLNGNGSEVILGEYLNDVGSNLSSVREVLTNNPIDPADPGTIETPGPWSLTSGRNYSFFPTYQDGKGGNDLLVAPYINDASGADFTAYQNFKGVPTPVTFSGLNTLVGGTGNDTFVVSNGGRTLDIRDGIVSTGAYDQVIEFAPSPGETNLIISDIKYLTLSDTDVSQGKFISQAWTSGTVTRDENNVPNPGQYLAGNRLDNTLSGYGAGDTLMGGVGRDSITGSGILIGGSAYGLDSIAGAMRDYYGVTPENNLGTGGTGFTPRNPLRQKDSIYRDTDPVPPGVNGAGSADLSQYWLNGNGQYDPLRNSDTLVGIGISIFDGGAGADSIVGTAGSDTIYVSQDFNPMFGFQGDAIQGGGGSDWVIFTASDYFWSGLPGATTNPRLYTLQRDIANLKLQDGNPIARHGLGNQTSTGNQSGSKLGIETGSNQIVGNEYDNILNGGGVGGASGNGVGVDVLTGGAGADTFTIAPYNYRDSSSNSKAKLGSQPIAGQTGNFQYTVNLNATDADYVVLRDFNSLEGDLIDLGIKSTTELEGYLIGAAPSSFDVGNMKGTTTINLNHFGIYSWAGDNSMPNLVAEVYNMGEPISLGAHATTGNGNQITGATGQVGVNTFVAGPVPPADFANFAGMGAMYRLDDSSLVASILLT